jgi:hypothetical protein
MRCLSCNTNLNDFESTAKSKITGEYIDMCRKCSSGLNFQIEKNKHNPYEEPPSDFDLEDGLLIDQLEVTEEEDQDAE